MKGHGRSPWRVLMPRKAETQRAARLLLDSLCSPSKAAALVAAARAAKPGERKRRGDFDLNLTSEQREWLEAKASRSCICPGSLKTSSQK